MAKRVKKSSANSPAEMKQQDDERDQTDLAPGKSLVPDSSHSGAERTAIVVLGMHRSGTSALTRSLSLLGAGLPRDLLGAGPGNEAGHWEPDKLWRYNDQLLGQLGSSWHDWSPLDWTKINLGERKLVEDDWGALISEQYGQSTPIVIKEPRLCRFSDKFIEALMGAGYRVKVVIAVRNPLDVADSLMSRSNWPKYYGFDDAVLLWLAHVLEAEKNARAHVHTIVSYERLMSDPIGTLNRVAGELEDTFETPVSKIADEVSAFLTADLRHHSRSVDDVIGDKQLVHWAKQAYQALVDIEAGIRLDRNRRELDRIGDAFTDAVPLLVRSAELQRSASAKADTLCHDVEALAAQNKNLEQEKATAGAALLEREAQLEQFGHDIQAKDEMIIAMKREHSDALNALQQTHALESAESADELETIRKRHDALVVERDGLKSEIDYASAALHALNDSRSWKLTAPLRAMGGVGRRLVKVPRSMLRLEVIPVFNATTKLVKQHGLRQTIGKTLGILRVGGVRGLANTVRRAGQVHGAPGQQHSFHPQGPGPQDLIDERKRFCIDLGDRPSPRALGSSVIVLTETDLPQCVRYRIKNKVETIAKLGVKSDYCDVRDLYRSLNELQFYSTVIFYRMPMSGLFMAHLDEARRLGMTIGYDIDDPSFDDISLANNPNLHALEPHYLEGQLRDAVLFRQAMALSDFLMTSTPHLRDLMVKTTRNKDVYLWRNVADDEAIDVGEKVYQKRKNRSDRSLVIGYCSGSLAHEADFDEALSGILELLSARPDVKLLVVGHLRDRPEFSKFAHRIERHPYSDYADYLELIGQCDLVMVPLADDPFNRSKSVVRYLDASVVGVPTVASAVGDYSNLLTDEETGFLVENGDWGGALRKCIADHDLRQRVGEQARVYVMDNFTTSNYRPDLPTNYRQAVFGI